METAEIMLTVRNGVQAKKKKKKAMIQRFSIIGDSEGTLGIEWSGHSTACFLHDQRRH